jgi:7-keto-8-aminopelargonate synthetase-like enzyme
MLFPCGYTTNIGVISALCGEGDLILNDAHNHASIFDGCGLSGADVRVYLHRNTRHLEKLLRQHRDPHRGGCLIATDGVFSMDGDLAPLPRILELAREHNARVLIDEAHAVGVIGTSGRGTAEHFGCQGRVDITVGTLSKAPGAVGGYCVGSAALIQYLRLYARTHFFSTSLPPPVVAGLIEVFHILMDDPDLHRRLWENVTYLRQGVKAAGFRIGDTESAIIPIIVGDEERLAAFSNATRRRGVVGNLVSYPAVRRKECRLRLNVMATLTKEDMDFALRILTEEGRRTGVLA